MSDKEDSNFRPPLWQSGALNQTELLSHLKNTSPQSLQVYTLLMITFLAVKVISGFT